MTDKQNHASTMVVADLWVDTWSYCSLLSNLDVKADFDSLEFGRSNIKINNAAMQVFNGLIYGPGRRLDLQGSITYGNPFDLRCQDRGIVGGAELVAVKQDTDVPA
jgi:hypothetical protein